jgi:hypothetical protein
MGAIHARRAAHSRSQNLAELRRNVDMLSGLAEEFRDDLASHVLSITGQIQRQISLAPPEQDLCFNATSPTVRRLGDIVSDDQDVIRVPHSEHFNAYESRRNHNGMAAIHGNRVDRLQPWKALASFIAEGHVAADLPRCPSGFHPTKDRALCQCLILERDFRLAKNPDLLESSFDPPSLTSCS